MRREDMSILAEISSLMSSLRAVIPLESIQLWMRSDNIEVLGAVADLVTLAPHSNRIVPPVPEVCLETFLFPYYARCLREDPDGEWSDTRYGVGSLIVGWYSAAPKDEDVFEQFFLLRMKTWMASVYLVADAEIRTALVNGALEHILEEPRWRPFFADWRYDPHLSVAYLAAMEWATEHER
jgi:hypothetical protein